MTLKPNLRSMSIPRTSSVQIAKIVTPSDTVDLAMPITNDNAAGITKACTSILLGTAGDVTVTLNGMPDGTSVAYTLAAGWHPLACKRIWDTGTDALTDLVANWS